MATTAPPRRPLIQLVTQEHVTFGGDPIVLVGDPRHCVGLVQVTNPQDVPVKLKRIHLRSSAKLGRCGDPSVVELKLSAGLCAGESQQLRVRVQLPPGTPPGCYEATLEGADGVARQVAIHVLERRRTQLSPPAITCGPSSGATFTVRVNARNLGNVAVVVPTSAPVELHAADRGWPFHFHSAAKAHGGEGHQAFLDDFVKRMSDDEPAVGKAKIVDGAGPLAAQQGRLLEIEVTLPKKLHNGRVYRALVRLADAVLRMTLHVTAADEELQSAPG